MTFFQASKRIYISAYLQTWKDFDKQKDDRMDAKVDARDEAGPIRIEKLVKQFKTNAIDFDNFL